MSQIISFSADKHFAEDFDNLITRSGYKNRSRFIRDASLYFAEIQQKGDLMSMDDEVIAEGHFVVYYQHDQGKSHKLLDLRHSELIEVASYSHSSLKHSHACVDVVQAKGKAVNLRSVIENLQNTSNVDKVEFISAPFRESGCC